MKKIAPKDIDKNVIKLIGQDWMLVTAGDQEKFNMMTASWGGLCDHNVIRSSLRRKKMSLPCRFLTRSIVMR